MVMDCIEVKGLTKKLYIVITVQEEDTQYFTQVHCSHYFMGCNIIQELTKNCLRGRPVSMQNFRLTVHIIYLFLHGCGLHYNILSGLSVKQEVKHNYALPRKKTFTCKYLSSLVLRLVGFTSS